MHMPVQPAPCNVKKLKYIREFHDEDGSLVGTITIHSFLHKAYMFYENIHGVTCGKSYDYRDGSYVVSSSNPFNVDYDFEAIVFMEHMVYDRISIIDPYALDKRGFVPM